MVESILKDIVLGETDHFNEKFSLSNSGLEYPFKSIDSLIMIGQLLFFEIRENRSLRFSGRKIHA